MENYGSTESRLDPKVIPLKTLTKQSPSAILRILAHPCACANAVKPMENYGSRECRHDPGKIFVQTP